MVTTFSPPRSARYCPSTGALEQYALVEAINPTESVRSVTVYPAEARLQSARAWTFPSSLSTSVKMLGSAMATSVAPVSVSDCRVHVVLVGIRAD